MKVLISSVLIASSLFMSCKKESVITEDFLVATLYYRLEMVDLDSTTAYSSIAATKTPTVILTQSKIKGIEIPTDDNDDDDETSKNHCKKYPNSIRCKPLPVLLEYFKIDRVGSNYVTLKWKSVLEDNFKAYNIQRSRDGKTFINIAQIKPKGSISEYIYTDKLNK